MLDPRIVPGAWVETRFGEAVVVSVSESQHASYRYHAHRCVYDDEGKAVGQEEKGIWVLNGDYVEYLTFLREPDDASRHVLTLTGPYGEGPSLPPSPPPVVPAGEVRAERASQVEAMEIGTDVFIACIAQRPCMTYEDEDAAALVGMEWDAWERETLRARLREVGWTLEEYDAATQAEHEAYLASLED
jgi:hypothetical protein